MKRKIGLTLTAIAIVALTIGLTAAITVKAPATQPMQFKVDCGLDLNPIVDTAERFNEEFGKVCDEEAERNLRKATESAR